MRYTAIMLTGATAPAASAAGVYLAALRRGGWLAALLLLLG